MSVSIRLATAEDARSIAEVHVASWHWAYRDDLPADALEGRTVEDRDRMWTEWFDLPLRGCHWKGIGGELFFRANRPILRCATDL